MKYLKALRNSVVALLLCFGIMPTAVYAEEKTSAEIPVTCTQGCEIKIEPVTKQAPMPDKDTVKIQANQTGNFKIDYNVPGTYEYKVYQLPHSDKQVQIDKVVYEVTITIYYTDDNVLRSSVVSKSNVTGAKPDKLHFENKRPDEKTPTPANPVQEVNTDVDGPNYLLNTVLPVSAGIVLMIILLKTKKRKKENI